MDRRGIKDIRSVLIANRGDPVIRAIKTLKRLGITAAVVYSEEDAGSDWVAASDLAFPLDFRLEDSGDSAVKNHYLDGKKIIGIAHSKGIDAVWPGWGFLAEDPSFAREVVKSGLKWIGPPSHVIEKMGHKGEATRLARLAGIPVIPEITLSPGADFSGLESRIKEFADKFCWPVLIKPALGGGGHGQAVVRSSEEVKASLENVLRINATLFKGGDLVVQKFFDDARHIEVQFVSDRSGRVVSLGERECSIQRRNQKVIEEAPSPAVTDEMRSALYGYVARLAQVVGYESAGTAEFLLSGGRFYFLEVNTRLQVEHPVTEEVTRIVRKGGASFKPDIFEEMLKIATGEELSFSQDDVRISGFAVEARVYAEDTERGFTPAPGDFYFVRFPDGEDIRVDPAFYGPEGRVSPNFDPMIAKIISRGKSRREAIKRLQDALKKTVVLGIPTNISFLREIIGSTEFCKGIYNTRFVASYCARRARKKVDGVLLAVSAALRFRNVLSEAAGVIYSGRVTSVPAVLNRIPKNGEDLDISGAGVRASVSVYEWAPRRYVVSFGERHICLNISPIGRNVAAVILPDNSVREVFFHIMGEVVQVSDGRENVMFTVRRRGSETKLEDPHAVLSGGKIVKVCVRPGDVVNAGDTLYVVESMKMETSTKAACAGRVIACHKAPGESVASGESVVTVEPYEKDMNRIEESDIQSVEFPAHSTEIAGELVASPMSLFEKKGIEIHELLRFIHRYFLGYDIPHDSLRTAALLISRLLSTRAELKGQVADSLAVLIKQVQVIQTLFSEDHANSTVYFIEHLKEEKRLIPKKTEELLKEALSFYGVKDLKDVGSLEPVLLRLMQAYRVEMETKISILGELIEDFVIEKGCSSASLGEALSSIASSPVFSNQVYYAYGVTRKKEGRLGDSEGFRDIVLRALRQVDISLYYGVVRPPVSIDYLNEYEEFLREPLSRFSPAVVDLMQRSFAMGSDDWKSQASFEDEEIKDLISRWFAGFLIRELPVDETARNLGVRIYELKEGGKKRFAAIAKVRSATLVFKEGEGLSIPELERAAVESYRFLKVYSSFGAGHGPNHVFIFAPEDFLLTWSSVAEGAKPGLLTMASAKEVSARVAGFARGINIRATEVIVNLKGEDGSVSRAILEVRHAKETGVISRPPFPANEREPESASDEEKALDEKQYRLGKLVNRDRAALLFDNGEFEELFFPDADGIKGQDGRPLKVGLNVYKGYINGIETLAYAGDFRIQGGALGEPEGKKLAAVVVLAYMKGVPLIGIHDGAGANIKGSVASLGWAGAYFGAIANTGGFSSPAKFKEWLLNHCEAAYFQKVLNAFGIDLPRNDEDWSRLKPLIHIHLNLGATVGMLVYGASISHMSIMVDQPAAYRVLTGAATVERVTGEKTTNYELGGARVHSRITGDIDFAFSTEEEAINHARKMVGLISCRDAEVDKGGIARLKDLPQPTSMKGAAIVLGRDAIRANVDGGLFYETRSNLEHAGGVLTGYAALSGHPVVIVASATDYGLHNPRAFKKVALAIGAAQEFRLPLIIATGANWDSLVEAARMEAWYQQSEMRRLLAEAVVPRFSIAMGPRSLEQSIHGTVDFISCVAGVDETEFETKRASILSHSVKDSFKDAMDWIVDILSILKREKTPALDPCERPTTRLRELIPEDYSLPYDMREVIREIFDAGSFIELWERDHFPLIVGFARLGGKRVGVIADDPKIGGGAQTVYSLSKFTRFNRLCERFGITIVELNDSPAFKPGREQEHSGIQIEGGKSIREECLSRNLKIAVTLRQNFGGRYIHANLKTLGPPRKGLVLKGARIGVMGPEGAVGVLFGKRLSMVADSKERARLKEELLKEYVSRQLSHENALKFGYAEEVVPLEGLREAICRLL